MAHFGRICPIKSCKDKCFPFLLTPFQIPGDLPIWENTCLDLKRISPVVLIQQIQPYSIIKD